MRTLERGAITGFKSIRELRDLENLRLLFKDSSAALVSTMIDYYETDFYGDA